MMIAAAQKILKIKITIATVTNSQIVPMMDSVQMTTNYAHEVSPAHLAWLAHLARLAQMAHLAWLAQMAHLAQVAQMAHLARLAQARLARLARLAHQEPAKVKVKVKVLRKLGVAVILYIAKALALVYLQEETKFS